MRQNSEEIKKAREIRNVRQILREYVWAQGLNSDSADLCLDAVTIATTFYTPPDSLEKLKQGQAFIAYSFGIGARKDGVPEVQENTDARKIQYSPDVYLPGKTNEGLARVISNLYQHGVERPVFAQWEIASALEEQGITLDEKCIAKPKEGYLGTGGVIKQFLEAGLQELDRVILVAHSLHVRRARAITRNEVAKQRGRPLEKVLIANTSDVEFDPNSVQAWTRSQEANVRHEIGVRMQGVLYNRSLTVDDLME